MACVILPHKVQVTNTARSRTCSELEPGWDLHTSSTITGADYECGDANLYSPTCPICLDDVQVPRITSCGHTFW